MTITALVALIPGVGALALGVLAYLRGRKADEALGVSRNTELTVTGQASLIDDLRREQQRHQASIKTCEQRCDRLLAENRDLKGRLGSAERRIEFLTDALQEATR